MTLHERVARGETARALLEAHKGGILLIEDEFAKSMLATLPGETEKRDMVFHEYHGFKRLVAKLKSWMQDGDMARAEIDREEKRQKRK